MIQNEWEYDSNGVLWFDFCVLGEKHSTLHTLPTHSFNHSDVAEMSVHQPGWLKGFVLHSLPKRITKQHYYATILPYYFWWIYFSVVWKCESSLCRSQGWDRWELHVILTWKSDSRHDIWAHGFFQDFFPDFFFLRFFYLLFADFDMHFPAYSFPGQWFCLKDNIGFPLLGLKEYSIGLELHYKTLQQEISCPDF